MVEMSNKSDTKDELSSEPAAYARRAEDDFSAMDLKLRKTRGFRVLGHFFTVPEIIYNFNVLFEIFPVK
jgi:hypothetical protein